MTRRTPFSHDSFDRDAVRMGGNRSFGFVFFAVFAVIGFI